MILLTKTFFYMLIGKVSKKFYKKMFKILFLNRFLQDDKLFYLFFYFEIEFIKGFSNVLLYFLSWEFLQGK